MKGNIRRFLSVIFFLSLLVISPALVYADANAQCAMWNPACPCGMGIEMNLLTGQCPGSGNTAGCPVGTCQEQTPKGPVQGICATAGKCKGVLTAEGKGVGLGQVQGIMDGLKGLMQGLQGMGGGGGGGGQGQGQQGQGQGMGGLGTGLGTTPWTGTTCTGAQYTVSYPSTDPCAVYQPPVSSSLNGGSSLLESFTSGNLNALDAANNNLQQALQQQQTGASNLLQNTIGSGAPGGQTQQTTSSQQGVSGQGSSLAQPSGGTSGGGSNEVIETTIPGTQNTGTGTGDVGAMSPNMTLEGGARGDITAGDSGATVYVGARDAENNRETAGFYGSSGGAGTSIVSRWCTSRPWATNFLSKIVSPGFFDGLCSWRGYQVGTPPADTTANSGARPVTVLQQRRISTTTAPVATTTVVVPAGRVQIWAVPAKVSLGSRTSVFWATENVTNCIETSPDGSFYQSSLSGGASTVPLTGPTTFSISCQDGAGNPVTGSVTVTIKN